MSRRRIKKKRSMQDTSGMDSPIYALHTDLHMHSNVSDGRLSPQGVLESAMMGGLQVIALTDHDMYPQLSFGLHDVESTSDQRDSLVGKQIFVIHGAEISVSHEQTEQHVLVYFPKEAPEEFRSYCKKLCNNRSERYDEMVLLLQKRGCRDLDDSVHMTKDGERALTRLHLAHDLIQKGYVKNVREAFDSWLAPLELPHTFPTIETVLQDMRDMGGMTSWAHPKLNDAKKWLPYFQECGLQAIEVYRLANKKYHAKKQLLSMAKSQNLFVTGGSDSHGNRPLGDFFIGLSNYQPWMKLQGLWDDIECAFQLKISEDDKKKII